MQFSRYPICCTTCQASPCVIPNFGPTALHGLATTWRLRLNAGTWVEGSDQGVQEIVLVIVTLAERVASRQILVVPVFSKVALIDGLPLKGVVRNATFDTKTQADSLQFVLFHLRSMVMHFPCRWVGIRCVSRSC